MNCLESVLRLKFNAQMFSLTPKKIVCSKRLQKDNKLVNGNYEISKGTRYTVSKVNSLPDSFSFSIVCCPEGKSTQYLKDLSFKTREEAQQAGWNV